MFKHMLGRIFSTVVLSICLWGMGGLVFAKNPMTNYKNGPQQHSQAVLGTEIQDEVFYFVLLDRFLDGDTSNEIKEGFDKSNKYFYHGGDLKGLTAKLSYIKSLGVTSIWISPVFKNQWVQKDPKGQESAGYHGYWITDFTAVDPHLGTAADLKQLIKKAHSLQLKVLLDIVINHTADIIKYKECHFEDGAYRTTEGCPYRSREDSIKPSYTAFVPEALKEIKKPDWLNDFSLYHNQGDSTFSGESVLNGDFVGLDDLDTKNENVIRGMIDIYQNWIREFRCDGFRVDTVKHVDIEFWQKWVPAIKKYAESLKISPFYIVGEAYDMLPQDVSRFKTMGTMPSLLDFPLQGAIRDVFAGEAGTKVFEDVFFGDDYYTGAYSSAAELLTFTGNHDMGRLGFYVKKAFPNISNQELVKRVLLGYALTFFVRGAPIIYYGDEQGFVGDGGDADAREDFVKDTAKTEEAFNEQNDIYKALKTFAKIRHDHPVLRRGHMMVRFSSDKPGIFAFTRTDIKKRQEYLVVFNSSRDKQEATLQVDGRRYSEIVFVDNAEKPQQSEVDKGKLTIALEPLSFKIFRTTLPNETGKEKVKYLAFVSPKENEILSKRVEVKVDLRFSGATAAADNRKIGVKIGFYAKIGAKEEFLGEDYEPPYRVFWDTSAIQNKTAVTLIAKAQYGKGQQVASTRKVYIEQRTPKSVTIHYENPKKLADVLVLTSDGLQVGPLQIEDGVIKMGWRAEEEGRLLIFQNIDQKAKNFVFDFPQYLSKEKLLKMSLENNDGDLYADLFMNVSGHVTSKPHIAAKLNKAKKDEANNYLLNIAANAATPSDKDLKIYLRGSMNDWKAEDQLKKVYDQVYVVKKELKKGSYEFKFADEQWKVLNYGGPISAKGLFNGASSNLKYNVEVDGIYSFYFFLVPQGENDALVLYEVLKTDKS